MGNKYGLKSAFNGVFPLERAKWGARISNRGRTLHLGTFKVERDAALAFDLACAILGRPLSSYNFPSSVLDYNAMLKLAMHLRSIDAIGMDEIEAIKNRYRLLKSAIATLEVVIKQETELVEHTTD